MDATVTAFAAFLIALNLVATLKAGSVPLMGLVVGSLSALMGLATMNSSDLPFQPYCSLLVVFNSILSIVAAGVNVNPSRKNKRRR